MKEKMRQRMDTIELLAKGDKEYCQMLQEMRELEKQYDAVLRTLPADQQNILCDYLSLCEEMSYRQLELACTYMCFPEA